MPSLLHFAVGNELFLAAIQLRRAKEGWGFSVARGAARERARKSKIGERCPPGPAIRSGEGLQGRPAVKGHQAEGQARKQPQEEMRLWLLELQEEILAPPIRGTAAPPGAKGLSTESPAAPGACRNGRPCVCV